MKSSFTVLPLKLNISFSLPTGTARPGKKECIDL